MVSQTAALSAPYRALVVGSVKEQKLVDGKPFPLVLNPSSNFDLRSAEAVASALSNSREWLEEQLLWHSAILLRGFPLSTAQHFNSVVEAFDRPELPYVGGAAPRTNVFGRVFTSNESPPDQKIPFHHEMAQVPEYPARVLFFCEVKPGEDGETPIVLSHSVYERMKAAYPHFVDNLEKLGLLYVRVLGESDDATSAIGRGWQSTFQTKNKEEAEKRASKLGMKLEWLDGGLVRTISGPIPAIKTDGRRGKKVWFNSMVAAYTGWQDSRNDRRKAVTFGDGTPLPEDAVLGCLAILHEESVAIPWQVGDVLILDNIAVQHARKSFKGPRRVLASLSK
ncbi:hypothetical protein KP509_20G003700 [Ceratopteris richardii]|uniref:TauD/TfdA-like domain-containing protein n=1 Tax=Ceratopteris richardii TaxID=49495 RepID=A0A8T2SE67_CERRI|nr:hypothetical protein KP509_20G003700 [Ceratopteris richardii]